MPKFLMPVDLNGLELLNARFQNLSTPPATTEGRFYYDTDDKRVYFWNGTAWTAMDGGSPVIGPGAITTTEILDGTILNIDISASAAIAVAKLAVTATDRLLGRDTAGAGAVEELTVGGGIEFTGTGIQTSAFTGDVTKSAGGTALTIASNAVTFAKMQDITTDRLLGRDTAATGDPEELTVGGGLEFTGAGGIQRSALTGNVTAPAGSNATTIAAGVVTNAMRANMAANTLSGNNTGSPAVPLDLTVAQVKTLLAYVPANITFAATDRLLGRDTAAGGAGEEIAVGGGIEFTGGLALQTSAFTGDVTKTAGGTALTIAADAVTNSKLANMAANSIKGNNTGGAADPLDLTVAQVKTLLAYNGTEVAFTPAGNIAAVTVSAAISELETDLTALIATTIEARDWKDTVDAATTAALPSLTYNSGAGTLTATANAALAAQDGVTLVVGDSLLVKDQASSFQNGIYEVTQVGSGAAPFILTRRADTSTAVELRDATVMIEGGTAGAGDIWTQTNNALADLTAATQTWVKTGEGNTTYTADGTTIELVGNSFRIATGAAGNGLTGGGGAALAVGAGTGISVAADSIALDTAVAVRKYATSVGDGAALVYVVTHNLNTQDVVVQVRDNTTPYAFMEPDIEATSVNTVTVRFAVAPTSNQYRVIVHA